MDFQPKLRACAVLALFIVSTVLVILPAVPVAVASSGVTIGTSTAGPAVISSSNHNCFFDNALWWCVYDTGSNIAYRSSSDGVTWSSATTIRAIVAGENANYLGVESNSVTHGFCYAYDADFITGTNTVWRCGKTSSGGTITFFSGGEHTLTKTLFGAEGGNPNTSIQNDTAGNIWIYASTNNGNAEFWQITANGVTSTKQLNCGHSQCGATVAGPGQGLALKLSSGEMAFVYAASTSANNAVCVITWSGSAFNTQKCSSTAYRTQNNGFSATTMSGTTVYMVAETTAAKQPVNWFNCAYPCTSYSTSETQMASETGGGWMNLASDNGSSGKLEVTYVDKLAPTTTIDYNKSSNSGGTWDSGHVLTSGETSMVLDTGSGSAYLSSQGCIGLSWQSGSGTVNVRFATQETCTTPPSQPTIIQSKSCTGVGSTGTCAFTSNTVAGHASLVIAGDIANTAVTSVTDSQSLSYSYIISADASTIGDIEGWYACNTLTSAADTITTHYGISVTWSIILYELSPLDCDATGSTGTGVATSSATVTAYTPNNPSLVIGGVNCLNALGCTTTAGSGYTQDQTIATGAGANTLAAEHITNLGTSETTPYTLSATSSYNEISMPFETAATVITETVSFSPSITISPTFHQTVTQVLSKSVTITPKLNTGVNLGTTLFKSLTITPAFLTAIGANHWSVALTIIPGFSQSVGIKKLLNLTDIPSLAITTSTFTTTVSSSTGIGPVTGCGFAGYPPCVLTTSITSSPGGCSGNQTNSIGCNQVKPPSYLPLVILFIVVILLVFLVGYLLSKKNRERVRAGIDDVAGDLGLSGGSRAIHGPALS